MNNNYILYIWLNICRLRYDNAVFADDGRDKRKNLQMLQREIILRISETIHLQTHVHYDISAYFAPNYPPPPQSLWHTVFTILYISNDQ